jgi:hypothetical protein
MYKSRTQRRSRRRSTSKNISRSRSRSRSKQQNYSNSQLPRCPLVYYCGNSMNLNVNKYDKIGTGYDCFKKGMGVGMNLELNKVKNKLKEKGIELVTKSLPKMKCIDRKGRVKEVNKYK